MSDNPQFAQANPEMRQKPAQTTQPPKQQLTKVLPATNARSNSHEADELPLPMDEEAEKAVLGSILIENELIMQVADVLRPDDFFNKKHAEIFTTLLDMLADEIRFDLVIVPNYLRQRGLYGSGENQIQSSYLSELMRIASPYNAMHYAGIVLEKSLARKIIKFGAYITKLGFDPAFRVDPAISKVEEGVERLLALRNRSKAVVPGYLPHEKAPDFIHDLAKRQEEEIAANIAAQEAIAAGKDKPAALIRTHKGKVIYPAPLKLKFGFVGMDGGTRPLKAAGNVWGANVEKVATRALFQRGSVTTVLAPPNGGKTRYGRWLADLLASDPDTAAYVLYIHTELNKEQMQQRRMASLAQVTYMNLVLGNMSDAEHSRRMQVLSDMSNWRGRADYWHATGLRMDEIVKQVHVKDRSLFSATGRHYDAIFLDYGHNTLPPKGCLSPTDEAAVRLNWQMFQTLTGQLNVAGMIFGQMNRLAIRKGRPEMDSGFGSSAIEHYSNQIFAFHYQDIEQSQDDCTIWCVKNTFGPKHWNIEVQSDEFYNLREI